MSAPRADDAPGSPTSWLVVARADLDDEVLHRAVDLLDAETEVARTTSADEVEPLLDRLDGRGLVVAGGDGTLHGVVQRLHAREQLSAATLALLPMGTGNDTARSFGLPLDTEDAARVARDGASVRADVLVSDRGEVVVNLVHAGIGAEAAARGEAAKERLGPFGYRYGALVEGVGAEPAHVTVEVDGQARHDGPALFVGVGNGACFGGGAVLSAQADPTDGVAELVVVPDVGLADRVRLVRALQADDLATSEGVVRATGTRVVIGGAPLRHDVDGEVSDPRSDVRYEVVHAAYTLRVPRSD